jgi:predicted RNase H-like HicB family nuclease
MRFQVYIYQDEDGAFIAECPIIPGCVSDGKTFEEAEENIKDAIRQCLEVRKELNLPPIVYSRDVEVTV